MPLKPLTPLMLPLNAFRALNQFPQHHKNALFRRREFAVGEEHLFHLVEKILTVEFVFDIQCLAFTDSVDSRNIVVGLESVVHPYKSLRIGMRAYRYQLLLGDVKIGIGSD